MSTNNELCRICTDGRREYFLKLKRSDFPHIDFERFEYGVMECDPKTGLVTILLREKRAHGCVTLQLFNSGYLLRFPKRFATEFLEPSDVGTYRLQASGNTLTFNLGQQLSEDVA